MGFYISEKPFDRWKFAIVSGVLSVQRKSQRHAATIHFSYFLLQLPFLGELLDGFAHFRVDLLDVFIHFLVFIEGFAKVSSNSDCKQQLKISKYHELRAWWLLRVKIWIRYLITGVWEEISILYFFRIPTENKQ